MACSRYIVLVGVANKTVFMTLVGLAKGYNYTKPVFRWIHCAYESLKCLDLEMRQCLCDDRQTKLTALPLAHNIHRVIDITVHSRHAVMSLFFCPYLCTLATIQINWMCTLRSQ